MLKLIDRPLFWRTIAHLLPDGYRYKLAVRASFRECMKDPAFRAELANWAPVNSPEGQAIINQLGN